MDYFHIDLHLILFCVCSHRIADIRGNRFLTLDPNVTGVFTGPYPLGIDPVSIKGLVIMNDMIYPIKPHLQDGPDCFSSL